MQKLGVNNMTKTSQEEIDQELDVALERLSVLVRSSAEWGDSYAHGLGASIRKNIVNQPEHIQSRFFEILDELGFQPAIAGLDDQKHHGSEDELSSEIYALKTIAKYYQDRLNRLTKQIGDLNSNEEINVNLSQYEKALFLRISDDDLFNENGDKNVVELFEAANG